MLGKIGAWRHVVVASSIGGTALLAATGVIGRGNVDERFESKVVTVEPAGDDGVRIREVVDQDFGTNDRHGYERNIPTDFGNPIDIEASSPDANADIDVTSFAGCDRIRLGDPDTTISGQHRYVLAYTLAGCSAVDRSTRPRHHRRPGSRRRWRPDRFEVVVKGLDLDDPQCSVGSPETAGGCTLERDGDVYRAVISPLKPGEGITIGGTITGRIPIAETVDPPLPKRRPDHRMTLALATIPLGSSVPASCSSRPGAPGATKCSPAAQRMPRTDRCHCRRAMRSRGPRSAWWPTARWTNWRPSSSCRRRASSHGRAPCC